jgi:hypothetical protein
MEDSASGQSARYRHLFLLYPPVIGWCWQFQREYIFIMAPVHHTLTPQYNSALITISTIDLSLKMPAPCFAILILKVLTRKCMTCPLICTGFHCWKGQEHFVIKKKKAEHLWLRPLVKNKWTSLDSKVFMLEDIYFRTLNGELISLTPWISDEDIQCVLADQPISKAYRLIAKGMAYHCYSDCLFDLQSSDIA